MIENFSSSHLIRNIISSDFQELDRLHEQYKWIPSSVQIRPIPEHLKIKLDKINNIANEWVSFKDYILHSVFQKPCAYRRFDNLLYATNDDVNNCKVFQPNEFPYDIEQGQHWVLWYGQETKGCLVDTNITLDIGNEIKKLCSETDISSSYDFAWYINPKMSIPEFFHVQVFWITT